MESDGHFLCYLVCVGGFIMSYVGEPGVNGAAVSNDIYTQVGIHVDPIDRNISEMFLPQKDCEQIYTTLDDIFKVNCNVSFKSVYEATKDTVELITGKYNIYHRLLIPSFLNKETADVSEIIGYYTSYNKSFAEFISVDSSEDSFYPFYLYEGTGVIYYHVDKVFYSLSGRTIVVDDTSKLAIATNLTDAECTSIYVIREMLCDKKRGSTINDLTQYIRNLASNLYIDTYNIMRSSRTVRAVISNIRPAAPRAFATDEHTDTPDGIADEDDGVNEVNYIPEEETYATYSARVLDATNATNPNIYVDHGGTYTIINAPVNDQAVTVNDYTIGLANAHPFNYITNLNEELFVDAIAATILRIVTRGAGLNEYRDDLEQLVINNIDRLTDALYNTSINTLASHSPLDGNPELLNAFIRAGVRQ